MIPQIRQAYHKKGVGRTEAGKGSKSEDWDREMPFSPRIRPTNGQKSADNPRPKSGRPFKRGSACPAPFGSDPSFPWPFDPAFQSPVPTTGYRLPATSCLLLTR